MTQNAHLVATDDWRVSFETNANVSFGLSLGGQTWTFFSPRLRYACICLVPRLGAGLSFGAELPTSFRELIDNTISASLHVDQQDVTIERPFSANSLDGGAIGAFSVGARGVVAGAEGHQILVRNRAGHDIVRVRGGSVSAGLGVEVNMGRVSVGVMYGPYQVRTPIMKAV